MDALLSHLQPQGASVSTTASSTASSTSSVTDFVPRDISLAELRKSAELAIQISVHLYAKNQQLNQEDKRLTAELTSLEEEKKNRLLLSSQSSVAQPTPYDPHLVSTMNALASNMHISL